MPSYTQVKNSLKIIIFILIILVVAFSLKSMINSTATKATTEDHIKVDIGNDNFLVANLDGCLKVDEKSIDDGYALTENNTKIYWYDAKNISFVDKRGNNGYMITWKSPRKKYESKIKDDYYTDYDNLTGVFNGSCYFISYNRLKSSVYGIILNKKEYTINNLIHDVLGYNLLSKEDWASNYTENNNYNYNTGSSKYSGVDTSPETLAKNDPDWYYDYYEYGDYPEIDDELESQGYGYGDDPDIADEADIEGGYD